MATLTLGQMLDAALGSLRDGLVDFEQLHNLLNAMLLHLGLRDLLVQKNGEPLEGAEESPFSFLKELKQKVEANEKEIAEVRALCQELREEVNVVKEEQSQMAEDMQYMLQNFDMEGFQNMMDEFRNQLMESLMLPSWKSPGHQGMGMAGLPALCPPMPGQRAEGRRRVPAVTWSLLGKMTRDRTWNRVTGDGVARHGGAWDGVWDRITWDGAWDRGT
ncbi:uncharacterized protein LOC116184280 [Lonchura striata]|uniref:uncharacterized protein n=1 Tax=Lonchura striata TaxID=40157 RepID=UPI001293CC79|nr:uncharacterized protein LOC116184280 [Lonchura striata domestica]